MIYLLLAIASSAMVSICMRLSEKHISNQMGMFMANYAVCIGLSAMFMNWQNLAVKGAGMASVIIMGVINGILYLAGFVFLKYNMKYNGMVLPSIFMRLGVLIPTLMAVVVFHEVPKWTQVIGICIAVVAIIMIQFEKDALKEGSKKIWLIVLLLLSGITDSMANIYEQVGIPEGKDSYLLITFVVACLLAATAAIKNKDRITIKDILFGMLIGIPNYFSARFLLLALGSVNAVLAYPMYSVATIIVISIAGVFVFRETISRQKAGALVLITVALCLLNI